MNDISSRHPITRTGIVLRLAGPTAQVTRDVIYRVGGAGPLTLDVYRPSGAAADVLLPAVLIVSGYRDVGVPTPLGCTFKDMEMVMTLAQAIAASGLAAVAYTTAEPARDLHHVVEFLAREGRRVGVNGARWGLWASSGNVPVALSAVIQRMPGIEAAVLSNGFMLDATGSATADAARTFRFADACAGHAMTDVPATVPLFVVRSGRDEFAGVNQTVDAFVTGAIAHNLPITFVNHPTAPHGFEINDDSNTSRRILEQMLDFLRWHLMG